MSQAEVNIGIVGHVDHGKTSLTKALSGVWTDTHSEEIKRGITIKLGYVDLDIKKCTKCGAFATNSDKCKKCSGPLEIVRKISLIDAPGHETLMATVIAASSIMDGAILVIAANEKCPQPQTLEHLMVLDIVGVKNLIVVQNKVDLVSPEKARENYNEIKKLLGNREVPIIPVSANYNINLDALIETIEKVIPGKQRDESKPARMLVARSFDINKPGQPAPPISGGIIGGSIVQGKLSIGDEIEISPGPARGTKKENMPIKTKIESLYAGKEKLKEAKPGGLIAIGTSLDPSLTKSDGMVGNIVGIPGKMPPVLRELQIEYKELQRPDIKIGAIVPDEQIVLGVGTATTVGFPRKVKGGKISFELKMPVAVDKGTKIAVSKRVEGKWRLAGFGIVL